MSDIRDFTGKNRKFTGTTGIKIPSGTQAERLDEAGQLRFNTDTNLAEYYDGTDWKPIDAPPTITGFTLDGGSNVTTATIDDEAGGDATFVISGSNFDATSGTVVFEPEGGGSNVTTQTITRTNSSSFTVTATRSDFTEANGPYAIKLTNGSGLAATLASAITPDDVAPVFNESAGSLGNIFDGVAVSKDGGATDADGQTITHSISAGALPSGLSISSSTGAITGTPSGNSNGTTYTFTVSAATATLTSTREFSLTQVALPTGGTITTYTSGGSDYRVHTFTSSGTWTNTISQNVDLLLVAGGGSGGTDNGGGAGAGGMLEPTGVATLAQGYTITIGGGGASVFVSAVAGNQGNNSSALGYTSVGGGYGGGWGAVSGNSGGSGAGQSSENSTGYTGPFAGTAGQGNTGGGAIANYSGGGGGKGGAGVTATSGTAGRGGAVGNNAFRTGSNIGYAGGGTGGWSASCGVTSAGHGEVNGVTKQTGGGGGTGTAPESDCAANTGHGGHGANHNDNRSGGGGSGICVIRYTI
jgi:hypothetical protein